MRINDQEVKGSFNVALWDGVTSEAEMRGKMFPEIIQRFNISI